MEVRHGLGTSMVLALFQAQPAQRQLISGQQGVVGRHHLQQTHDESFFGTNDGRSYCWLDEKNREIRPKGNGRSIMVYAFLCEFHAISRLDDELKTLHSEVPADSTVFLKPGANSECYWKNSDLIAQVKDKAIPIFRLLHEDCDALFMFDNSQNHHESPPDALNAKK